MIGKQITHSVNFMQVGDVTHCLRCHQDISNQEGFHVHLITVHPYNDVDSPTPCTEKCGKWYVSPPKVEIFHDEAVDSGTSRSKYWNTMCDILEGAFPKGFCKERGRALVMLSYIEMMLQGYEFDENGEPIPKKK